LAEARCILVPFAVTVDTKRREAIEIAKPEFLVTMGGSDEAKLEILSKAPAHELYARLRKAGDPGLVLFSSGSSGQMKAVVHNLAAILKKFQVPRHKLRTITFLLYDHIGGVNTMLYALANGGCIITVPDRNPDTVLSAIEKHRAELLPTSPTFLNLILLGDAYRRFNLSSLKTVTYGTEPMPESTLKRFHALFPDIQLLQTYGLSETGILRSKSKSSDSLWMKVGGEGFETRVVDGILHIKAESAMLGYLNAPSPFTADGWINTGDQVETDGEYIRVLGRKSEIINVGGEKVYPSEVESVIHELDNVAEATVYGEKNFIMGNIVCAKVSLVNDENADVFAARLKKFCAERMQRYKVPVKVEVVNDKLHSERVKKIRKSGA
jgi:acyl-CoA synthetase (AMP-forming)/AMP-acid ligase II